MVALAVLGLVLGLAPVTSPPRLQATVGRCATEWSSAVRLGDLRGGLLEVSGFVSSARHPGVAWMIRDSDNPASLYSFQLDGDTPRWKEFRVPGTSNFDWEDLAYTVGPDGRGRLWILENAVETGPKKVYEVLEPDPAVDERAEVLATYRFDYPGDNLNTEAMFAVAGRLSVVSKTNPNGVYQLPAALSRAGTNRAAAAGRIDVGSFVTAASTSADERLLLTVSTKDVLTVFENRRGPADVDGFVGTVPVFSRSMPETQREAGDFFPHASCDIVLVSEDASVWRLSNSRSGPVPFAAPEPPSAPPPSAPPASGGPPATEPPGARPGPGRPGGGSGYWMLGADGAVHGFGDARHLGQPPRLDVDTVDLDPTPSAAGYWVLAAAGRVHAYGDAPHLGDVERSRLDPGEVVASLSRTPSGNGYWVFTTRGRVVPFGDAGLFGDLSGIALNGPVLDAIPTPTGLGYYMVASDGGVFTFGDGIFRGSMGDVPLNAPVESLVPDPAGAGYWLVASDGGVFAFGAPFRGSMGGVRLNRPISGMVAFGNGYLMVGEDGGVFNFSDRAFAGSLGDGPPARPIVSVAAVPS